MGRNKLYDKRFHFWGPAELDARARSLAERRGAAGERTTAADVLREALTIGLDALETGARYAHESSSPGTAGLHRLDPDDIQTAADVIENLVTLGEALYKLDVGAIKALGDLDADILRSLSHLDPETLDALASLDVGALVALESLDLDHVIRLADAISEAVVAP